MAFFNTGFGGRGLLGGMLRKSSFMSQAFPLLRQPDIAGTLQRTQQVRASGSGAEAREFRRRGQSFLGQEFSNDFISRLQQLLPFRF